MEKYQCVSDEELKVEIELSNKADIKWTKEQILDVIRSLDDHQFEELMKELKPRKMKTNLYKEMQELKKHDETLTSRVEKGKFQLVTVIYDANGKSHIVELSDYLKYKQFVLFLVDFRNENF